MNSKVHPLVAALVIALNIVAITIWVWGMSEAANIGGPSELRTDRNGHLYIQIQNKLVEHDADGAYLETHDLSSLGVERLLGGFAFFSNGDILLRRGPDPRSFFDDIRAFQRKTNEQTIDATTPGSGLFRCNLRTDQCSQFGTTAIDLKAAFGIFIDWSNDDVYISDTSRHLLRKYSDTGEPIAGPVPGFSFPNQLFLKDDKLYVADTNSHSIQVLDPSNENFGAEIANEYVVPSEAVRNEQRWPSHMASVGDEWWVNNMRDAMDDGGIYVFDAQWAFDRKLALPDGADPISLVVFRDEVLISDWKNDRVYRFAKSGELTGEIQSAGLAAIIDESLGRRSKYQLVSYSGMALLVLIIGGLFVRALVVTMSPIARDESKSVAQADSLDGTLHIEPTQAAVSKGKKALQIAGALLIVLVVSFVVFASSHASATKIAFPLIVLAVGTVPIYLVIAWVGRENLHSSIRVEGEYITLRNRSGKESRCLLKDARYDKTIVATHDMAVFLGQAMAPLYDRDVLQDELFPRLAKAQKLSAMRMQLLLLELRHPQGVVTLLAALSLLIYAVWSVAGKTA